MVMLSVAAGLKMFDSISCLVTLNPGHDPSSCMVVLRTHVVMSGMLMSGMVMCRRVGHLEWCDGKRCDAVMW